MKTEAMLRGILDAATEESIWLFDWHAAVLYANPAALKRVEMTAEEVIGRDISRLVPPEVHQPGLMEIRQVINTGLPVESEDIRNGISFRHRLYPVRDDSGVVTSVACISHDISSEKAARTAKEALRIADAKLIATLEKMNDGFASFDREWRYTYVNSAAAEMFKVEPASLLGKTIWEMWPPAYDLPVGINFRRSVEQNEPINFEAYYPEPLDRWFECRCHPTSDGLTTFFTDITERKRAEEKQQESERLLREILEQLPVGATLFDRNGEIRVINEKYRRLLPARIPSRDPQEQKRWRTWDAQGRPVEPRNWPGARALRGESVLPGTEFLYSEANGREVWRRISAVPFKDPSGEIAGAISVIEDIDALKQAEARLKESEERFRVAQELSPDGFLIFRPLRDDTGAVTDFLWLYENEAAGRMNDTDPKKVCGKRVSEVLPHHHMSPFHQAFIEVADTGDVRVVEEGYYDPGTSSKGRWFRIVAVPTAGGDVAVLAQDVTERRATADALRQFNEQLERRVAERTEELAHANEEIQTERQRFLNMLDTLPVVIDIIRADHRIEWTNRAYREALGDNVGRLCYHSQFGYEIPCQECQAFVPLQTGLPHHWEWTLPNGRTFDIYNFPFAAADGSPAVLEMDIDITEIRQAETVLKDLNATLERRVAERTAELEREIEVRKQAEETLARAHGQAETERRRLEAILEISPVGIVLVEAGGKISLFNRRAAEIYGTDYCGSELEAQVSRTFRSDGTPCPVEELPVTRAFGGEKVYNVELAVEPADGIRVPLVVSAVPLPDATGKTTATVTVFDDISDRKRAENELKELNEELERRVAARTAELRERDRMLLLQSRQAAMGEMIGNIAHQWRQPLNNLGLTVQELLLFYDLGRLDRTFLVNSVQSSMQLIKHMSTTIEDFKNYFKPDKEKTDFRLCDAIAKTLALLKDSLKDRHIKVEVNIDDGLIIHGYSNEFAQALLNILNNARDVLTEREIENPKVVISAFLENSKAVTTVTDNAGGIPAEIMDKIFDPYFTTKGPQQGTGIGLYMSKSIIEKNMGGRLSARNAASGAELRIEV